MKIFLLILCMVAMLSGCQSAQVEKPYSANQPFDLRDTDSDGVINARDICANSSTASEVDIQGCALGSGQLATQDFVFNFDFDSSQLRAEHQTLLNQVAALVKSSEQTKVSLVGDTSSEGTDEYNHQLGKKRADAIVASLATRGISSSRIAEYVYDQTEMKALLKKRERRTIVRVQYPATMAIEKWTIYSAETRAPATAKTGVKK